MSEWLAADLVRRASESVEVRPPAYDAIVARARAGRRRRWRLTAAGLAVALVVVGAVTWAGTRSSGGPDGLPDVTVRRAPNPVDVAWYAEGVLHLDRVAVELPDVTAVVEEPGGAVYATERGDVVFVAADGTRRRIGHKDALSALVGSAGDGWAAWVDAEGGGSGRPALMVFDVPRGVLLAPHDVPASGVTLIAIDQRRVYLTDRDGTSTWDPVARVASDVRRPGLVDVESATRVYQEGRHIDMVQPFFSVDFLRPGVGAELSAGGLYALSRTPRLLVSYPDGSFRPLLYDVRSGERLGTGVTREERVLDAAFGKNGTIVYLVTAGSDGAVVLRQCSLREPGCSDRAVVQPDSGRALLAH